MRALCKLKAEYFLLLQIKSLLLHAEIPWECPKETQTPPQARVCMLSTLSLPEQRSLQAGLLWKAHFVPVLKCYLKASSVKQHPSGLRVSPVCLAALSPKVVLTLCPGTSSPGFASTFRNITQLSASSYNRGHVSPAKVKHRREASPAPFQMPRSTLDWQPAAAQVVIKLLTAAWISMV